MNASLLISEPPLQVLPSLAVKCGLNEAIVLQQVHYWLIRSTNIKDGYKWVYNSYPKWQSDNFPFWSIPTIKRAFTKLEKQGYLISSNYNKAGFDKTKWYRINYQKLVTSSSYQNGPTIVSKCTDGAYQNDTTNTRDYTENTTETNKIYSGTVDKRPEPQHIPYKEIIDYLNQKAGTKYKSSSKATKNMIKARFDEGNSLADFKKVIDNQAFAWQDTSYWKYMRPSTLFRASKFEGYLNANALDKEKEVPHGGYTGLAPDIGDVPDDELPF